jgi:ornithine--oxo-acid transaminase
LFIADEVQTDTPEQQTLCCDHHDFSRHLSSWKTLSGGVLPVSVLTRDEIILTIKPGEHGSTLATAFSVP